MNNTYNIAVLAGDAIGPEITREALRVLRLVEAALVGLGRPVHVSR